MATAIPFAQERVLGLFSAIAPRYDLFNSVITGGLMEAWRRRVVREVAPQGRLALDVACGTGGLTLKLAEGGARVVGVDFCPPMLAQGQAKAEKKGRSLSLVLGHALSLPFPDGVFDGVTIAFAARNLTDLIAGLREMRRVVKDGGKLVCLELVRPASFLARAWLRLYLLLVVPLVGGLLTGRGAAYLYLLRSLERFPMAQGLKEVMEEAGWRRVGYRFLFPGVALHWGLK